MSQERLWEQLGELEAQWRRLGAAAERWLAEQATGAPDCRFDVVLVDGAGVAERVENAHSFDV